MYGKYQNQYILFGYEDGHQLLEVFIFFEGGGGGVPKRQSEGRRGNFLKHIHFKYIVCTFFNIYFILN